MYTVHCNDTVILFFLFFFDRVGIRMILYMYMYVYIHVHLLSAHTTK